MQAAKKAEFQIEQFGTTLITPLIALNKTTENPIAKVYISSGIHGDEPAGALALLELLQIHTLPPEISFFICPLLNPWGMQNNKRTNADKIDIKTIAPEAIYLVQNHSKLVYTLETPTNLDINVRVKTHIEVIKAMVNELLNN